MKMFWRPLYLTALPQTPGLDPPLILPNSSQRRYLPTSFTFLFYVFSEIPMFKNILSAVGIILQKGNFYPLHKFLDSSFGT